MAPAIDVDWPHSEDTKAPDLRQWTMKETEGTHTYCVSCGRSAGVDLPTYSGLLLVRLVQQLQR